MPDAPDASRPADPRALRPGSTLDLSTGRAPSKVARKGPPPVVVKTINLSTPRPPKAAPEPPPPAACAPTHDRAQKPHRQATPRRDAPRDAPRRDDARPSGGNSLADLLDAETLARLRGR